MADFSHDQAVKSLIKAYPEEALEFLAEDVVAKRGMPTHVEFLDTSVKPDNTAEPGPGMAMDLAIRYLFADGQGILFVLVEHWSDASKLDLLRTARYYIDLCRRFPSDEILPIALVDDDKPRDLSNTVGRGALGDTFLSFKTRLVQIPSLELERYRESRNRVALSFLPNMHGTLDPVERVLHVALYFHRNHDTLGLHKFFAFWIVEARLKSSQQRDLNRRIRESNMPEIIDAWIQEGMEKGIEKGMEKGVERGLHEAHLDNARKMLAKGCDWDFITEITGITPEDISNEI